MRTNRVIKHYEGLHDGDLKKIGLQPKMCPAGVWTEGWGHAITYEGRMVKGAKNKDLAYSLAKVSNEDEAEFWLAQDCKSVDLLIARKIKVDLTPTQYEALQSFYYNCGYSATLTKMINEGNPKLYTWWTRHYITGGGRVLKGLIYRRKTEARLFVDGELTFYN